MNLVTKHKRCGCAHVEATTILNFHDELTFVPGEYGPRVITKLVSECGKCFATWAPETDGMQPEQLLESIKSNVNALIRNTR